MEKEEKRVILAKIETVYGTDSVPTGVANAIEATNVQITPMQGDTLQRNLDREFFGGEKRIIAGKHVQLSFDVEIAGSGTVDTPPAYGPLLRACALAETINAAVSVQYDPVSASEESATIYAHEDGTLHKLLGWRGNAALDFTAGQLPKITFSGLGLLVLPAASALPTGTYTGWKTPAEVSNANTTAATLHGFSSDCESIKFDQNNKVAYRNIIGREGIDFSGRDVQGSAVIEAPAIGTQDFFAISDAETLAAITLTHGVGGGNIVEVTGPQVQILPPSYGNSDGIKTLTLPLAFVPSAGDDEIMITTK